MFTWLWVHSRGRAVSKTIELLVYVVIHRVPDLLCFPRLDKESGGFDAHGNPFNSAMRIKISLVAAVLSSDA